MIRVKLSFFLLALITLRLSAMPGPQTILLDGIPKNSIAEAFLAAEDGSIIRLGPGEFQQAGTLTASNVLIEGVEGTKIHSTTTRNKGALVLMGHNIFVRNIECFNIQVSHNNGACIRFEGKDLIVDNVYFHDSQQGILTGSAPGKVNIRNSRFERLGKRGRAHAIYVGGGQLEIENSYFLSSKDQGHEIKSRAEKTVIRRSLIANLQGNDSRLIDIPNGGILEIYDSILQQSKYTVNSNLIGYGLEGDTHGTGRVSLVGNMFILDRHNNHVLKMKHDAVQAHVSGNIFIGKMIDRFSDDNIVFDSRKEAKMKPYPFIPELK